MNPTSESQREAFKSWLARQTNMNGAPFAQNTINTYVPTLSSEPRKLRGVALDSDNLYDIISYEAFTKLRPQIENAENFDEINQKAGNLAFKYALKYYEDFLKQQEEANPEQSKQTSSTTPEAGKAEIHLDKNIILYGPPGTGKTYKTVVYAVAIIENQPATVIEQEVQDHGYEPVLARYRAYKENGQVAFTTFHQSYGYEEFIEGIKPKMSGEAGDPNGTDISYEIKPGIFKQFCEEAAKPIIPDSNELGIRKDPTIWKVSLGGARENPVKRDCFNNNRIRIGWSGYGPKITEQTDFSTHGGKDILTRFIDEMTPGDIVLVLYDEKTIDAIGVVTGDYEWLDDVDDYKRSRQVKWLAKDIRENIYELNENKVMTQGAVYRLNRFKFKHVQEILKKHNHSPSITDSIKENANRYVFIIDEINRGNISKIFGELITLIEPTKRIGQPEEIKLSLPYSTKEFGIPDNVYILATMNTADRSIALLDTALRRRFRFIEMMPNPQLLSKIAVEEIDISAMLTAMNRRIEVLHDREHAIGHAYFMPLTTNATLETLAGIFKNAIIPLLQEYFYADYHLIQLVLGDNNKEEKEQFIQKKQIDVAELFGSSIELDLDDAAAYQINEQAFGSVNAYRKIYEVQGDRNGTKVHDQRI